MNITQMIQDGEPAVAAAVAALVDPAIQPDALRMAAVDLARQQAELRDQKPVARAEQVGEQVVARWLTSDHAMVCPAGTLLYAAPPTNQCGETCERAKLCATCARGLEHPSLPAGSEARGKRHGN